MTAGVPAHTPLPLPSINLVHPREIFCLVVRLSGYFVMLMAAGTVLAMILGPLSFGFMAFLNAAVSAAGGAAIIKLAPAIGAFAYPSDAP